MNFFNSADWKMDTSAIDEKLCEEILAKIEKVINSGICQDLSSIWTELWDEEEKAKRREILANECQREIKEFLLEVVANERKARDNYVTRIEELLNEMNDLQTTLETVIPYEDVENLPLHIMASRLNKKAEVYRVMRNNRVKKVKELAQREAELCEKLGMLPQASKSEVPSKAEMKILEDHIAVMEQEKVNRTVTFLEKRQAIIKLYEELGVEPLLEFEKNLVSEEAIESFKLTNENMKSLDDLGRELESQLQEAKEKVKELTDKLELLWKYLGETEEYKENFLSKHTGCTVAVITSLKEEVSRCETKKRENIAEIVNRIRQVLVEEWDRCLIGPEEREDFRAFKLACFTEDLCDLHEMEIKRLKQFYQDNEQIFVHIAKHEKLFNKLLELENGSKNANRYYNRGGQLLQEEKERKLITKELPIVEDELRALLKDYKEKNNKPFTSLGVPMELILDEQWNAHFDKKTIEKLHRRRLDKKVGTPLGKRGCTTPYTPLSANKVPKLNSERLVSSTNKQATPRIPTRGVTTRRKLAATSQSSDPEPPQPSNLNVDPTYDDFQNALQSKVEKSAKYKKPVPRSTAVNEVVTSGILRERNTPNKIKPVTPIKSTPGKMCSPMWSPFVIKSPKTLPKARRQSKMPRLTPARNRLPIII